MNVEYHSDIKQPDFTSAEDCLVIYSPKSLTIKPREDAYLDLQFNVEMSTRWNKPQFDHLPNFWLNLSSPFKTLGLFIEESDWVSNRTKHNTIQLHLLNISYYYTIDIKKDNVLGYIFLLGKTDNHKIIPTYKKIV